MQRLLHFSTCSPFMLCTCTLRSSASILSIPVADASQAFQYSTTSTQIGFSCSLKSPLARQHLMVLSQTLLSVQEAASSMELLTAPADFGR